jgi:predicted  nucleic acid-binding Zn-ribbon protein
MAKKNDTNNPYSTDAIGIKLEGLFQLQNIDTSIDNLKILRGELPLEIDDLVTEIASLNDRLLKQNTVEEELKDSISQQQQKIKASEALIEKYNTQQSKVRNNREFNAINKELEFQSLDIELSNKKIKSFDDEVTSNKLKIKLLKAKIKERKKHLKAKKDELSAIVKSTEKDEKKLLSDKKKTEKLIEDKSLRAYNSIRSSSKNGLAVVKVARDACGGCFNSITAQHRLNIQMRKDVLFCESCGRILVPNDIDGLND